MVGLSIMDLLPPKRRYRVDLHSPGFETRTMAAAEDAVRAKQLRKWAKGRKGKRARRVRALADLLDPKLHPYTLQTLASARYMREQRIRIIGAVWKLVDTDQTGETVRFDVIKPGLACRRKRVPPPIRSEAPERVSSGPEARRSQASPRWSGQM